MNKPELSEYGVTCDDLRRYQSYTSWIDFTDWPGIYSAVALMVGVFYLAATVDGYLILLMPICLVLLKLPGALSWLAFRQRWYRQSSQFYNDSGD